MDRDWLAVQAWPILVGCDGLQRSWPSQGAEARRSASAARCTARRAHRGRAGDGYGIFQILTYSTVTDASYNANTQFTVQASFVGFLDQDTCAAGKCMYIASGPYVADQMRWLRMLPTNGRATITAQISADGLTWTEYAHRDLAPPAVAAYVSVSLGGGNNGGTAGRTVYQQFDICQD